MKRRAILGALLWVPLVGCDEDEPAATTQPTTQPTTQTAAGTAQPSPAVEAELTRARELTRRFGSALKKELKAGLAQGAPAAIAVCHEEAPAIAGRIDTEGWTIGRTSSKLRNPDNAPDDWERRVLERFEQQRTGGADPAGLESWEVVEQGGERRLRYMKAIPTQALCLTCHGEPSGEVEQALGRLYPKDQATGFEVGDIRGAFTLQKTL